MKHFIKRLGLAVCAVLLSVSTAAFGLEINDDYYVGGIDPGVPAGNEAEYVDYLVRLFNGETLPNGDPLPDSNVSFGGPHTQSFTLTTGSLAPTIPDAPSTITDKEDPPIDNTFDVTGVLYIIGKYGQGAGLDFTHVWYVGELTGDVTLPWDSLSHVSTMSGGRVPDAGATLALFGLSLLGVGAVRRIRK